MFATMPVIQMEAKTVGYFNHHVYNYDSVEKIKNAIGLEAGDIILTDGYYHKNDGGNSVYKIVNDTSSICDNCSNVRINNNLIAKLMPENNTIRAEQFGIKFNGTDESEKLDKLLSYSDNINIVFPKNKTLLVSRLFTTNKNNLKIKGNNTTIKMMNNSGILENQVIHKKYIQHNHCPGILNFTGNNNYIENLGIDYNYQNNMYTDSKGQKWAKLGAYDNPTLAPDEFKGKSGGVCCIEVSGNYNELNGLICKNGTWGNIHINGINEKVKGNKILNCTSTTSFQDNIFISNSIDTVVENNNIYDSYFHYIHVYNNNEKTIIKNNTCSITSNYKKVVSPYPNFSPAANPFIVISHSNYPTCKTKEIIVQGNTCTNSLSDFKNNNNSSAISIQYGFPNNVIIKDNNISNFKKGIDTNIFQYGTNTITNNTINNCTNSIDINLSLLKSLLNTDLSNGGTTNGMPSFRKDLPHCSININNNYFNNCGRDINTTIYSKCDLDLTKYNSGSVINISNNHLENTQTYVNKLLSNSITTIKLDSNTQSNSSQNNANSKVHKSLLMKIVSTVCSSFKQRKF